MNKLERKGVKEIALAARQAGRARKDMMGAEREAGRSVRDQMQAMSKASVAGRQAGRANTNMRKGVADEMRGATRKMAKGGYVRKADGCVTKGRTKGRMV